MSKNLMSVSNPGYGNKTSRLFFGYPMSKHKIPRSIFSAPVWQVGFRPFFIATCLSGALLPMLWVIVYSNSFEMLSMSFNPFISPYHWHIHEMFFGFGWALLGGFLLTATKNWVGIRGRHGSILLVLVLLWTVERIAMGFGGDWPQVVVYFSTIPFIVLITLLLEIDLIRNYTKDTYKDNFYFILALPIFVVAKLALLTKEVDPALGISISLGLFRLCFLLMLERTMEAFMKVTAGVALRRIAWVDHTIKALGFILIFAFSMQSNVQSALCLLLACLMLVRWLYWHPSKALSRIDVGVMYLGYLAIVANLVLQGLIPLQQHWSTSVATHVFTLGTIGLVAPAMVLRISNGHTGRKVLFTPIDKLCIYLMLLGFGFRVLLPIFEPHIYTECLYISALCWLVSFSVIGYRYIPILLKPRIDGKAH